MRGVSREVVRRAHYAMLGRKEKNGWAKPCSAGQIRVCSVAGRVGKEKRVVSKVGASTSERKRGVKCRRG